MFIKKSKYNAMVEEIAKLKDECTRTTEAFKKLEAQLQKHDPKTGRFVKKS